MAKIINKPFVITMTSGVKVKIIETPDILIAGAFVDFPSLDSVKRKKVTGQFVQAFGMGTVKGMLEMGPLFFQPIPSKKMTNGNKNGMISSAAWAAVHAIYHLVDITPDFYIVRGAGTITADKDARPQPSELDGACRCNV